MRYKRKSNTIRKDTSSKSRSVVRLKKVKNIRVKRTRNNGTWTESQFWMRIRESLRKLSMFWKPVAQCRANARRKYNGKNKRQKWEYQCNICKDWFRGDQITVDHINPAGTLKNYTDLPGFVERLFCEIDGLQCACNTCHTAKTASEGKVRRTKKIQDNKI